MSHSHAIVWMDSHEAHTFSFSAHDVAVEKERIVAHSPFRKLHHKSGAVGAGLLSDRNEAVDYGFSVPM